MSTVKFWSQKGDHIVCGGVIRDIKFPANFPIYDKNLGVLVEHNEKIPEGESVTFDVGSHLNLHANTFVFGISDKRGNYSAIVGITRKGTRSEISGNMTISGGDCLFQQRTSISEFDRQKNKMFYNFPGFEKSKLWNDPFYWALAVAAMEYGVPIVQSPPDYSKPSPGWSVSAGISSAWRSASNQYTSYPPSGGVSIMSNPQYDLNKKIEEAVGAWKENVSPYFGFDLSGKDPTLTQEKKKDNFFLYKGKRILLPTNTRHTGELDGLLSFEHTNGKVKRGSILCLLNSKERDPNLLMLVEDQIKAAQSLAASLEIFAEVLRQEGQVVEPNPVLEPVKKTRNRKEKIK